MNKSLLAAALASLALNAVAGPADYVSTPTVEYGEKEIELKYGDRKLADDTHERAATLGFGMGVTPTWFTEVNVEFEKETGKGGEIEAFEWENKFQLTEPGQYAVDVGLFTEIEIPHESGDPYELKVGPLFQTEFGKTQINANLLFERKFGGGDAVEKEVEMGYQWQVKYRLQPEFEFGAQGFGEVGEWNDWEPSDEQSHVAGPAVFGKVALSSHTALKYNAALLLPLNEASPDRTLRFQMEYEF